MTALKAGRLFWILPLFWLLASSPLWAAGPAEDVTAADKITLRDSLSWCATDATVGFEQVRSGACPLRSPGLGDLSRGLDGRAFWLRATLKNPGATPVERWVSVGHPRLEEVSLFKPDEAGRWLRRDTGIRTPLAQRDEVGRIYGVFSVHLPAGSEQTIWLRVASATAIDLSTTVWAPESFRVFFQSKQFSLNLALGALFIVMVLALMAFLVTRSPAFLFFALSMLGELLIESFRSGELQRQLLPTEMAMPVQVAALGGFLAVFGFTAFFRVFVADQCRRAWLFRAFLAVTGMTLLAQVWSMAIDYRAGVYVWSYSVNVLILLGIFLAVKSWRTGMGSAGTFILSFAVVACLELLRLGAVMGALPFFWAEVMAGPWALVMTTPLVLLSLSQRSQEMHDKVLRLELENKSRLHFLAQMSHELRSPLNAILGNTQLMRRHPDRPVAGSIEDIEQNGSHLLRMIDEILDHARGEAGHLAIVQDMVDWPAFLSSIEHLARRHALQQNNAFSLVLQGAQPAAVRIDGPRLRQVLENLLSNAGRHTTAGQIRLHCSATRVLDRICRLDFAVTDTGEGIRPEEMERIFLPFERGSHAHRSGKGTGMGLAIAKQLVEAMGGKIRALSGPGKGARFEFSLTVSVGEVGACQFPPFYEDVPIGYFGAPKRILLADDDPSARAILVDLLTLLGFEVDSASSGNLAVKMLRESRPDLVLVDQFMRVGDGWQVLENARLYSADLPVFLLSSAPPDRPNTVPVELSFDAHFLKPLKHHDLVERIGKVLGLTWKTKHAPNSDSSAAELPSQRPDKATLEQLRSLIDTGQVSELMAWARTSAKDHPELDAYAECVYQAALRLDISELNRLCAGDRPG